MRTFKAKAAAAVELPDLNVFVVVLAEQPDGSGRRLEIQIALSFDDQDRELGDDTYCLCTEDGATHYGGVVSWELSARVLEVILDAPASEELDADGGFRIDLDVEPNKLATLKGLQRVLESGR